MRSRSLATSRVLRPMAALCQIEKIVGIRYPEGRVCSLQIAQGRTHDHRLISANPDDSRSR